MEQGRGNLLSEQDIAAPERAWQREGPSSLMQSPLESAQRRHLGPGTKAGLFTKEARAEF